MLQEPRHISHRQALLSALLIVVISGVFAVASNRLRSRSMALFKPLPAIQEGDIDLLGARQVLQDKNFVFLDARSQAGYEVAHIPGALSTPIRTFYQDYPALSQRLQNKTIIVYCQTARCPKADILRGRLEQKGHTQVKVLRVGFLVWVQERLPTESGPQP